MILYIQYRIKPDIAGVKAPSPMTMHVPRTTRKVRIFCAFGLPSKNFFVLDCKSWFSLSPWSDLWSGLVPWRAKLFVNFTWRHKKEYSAKVPPDFTILGMRLKVAWINEELEKNQVIKSSFTFTIVICMQNNESIFDDTNHG